MRILGTLLFAALLPIVALAAQVNINTATVSELDTLPGIGPAKAQAIVTYRTDHGPFTTIEEIQNVSGIGPSTYANLKDLIAVDGVTSVSQPAPAKASYIQTQEVDPITNKTTVSHEEEYRAPAAVTQTSAAGAALPAPRAAGLLHSVWTYGLVGVMLVASGLFIFL
jgi:competence protein ComEA